MDRATRASGDRIHNLAGVVLLASAALAASAAHAADDGDKRGQVFARFMRAVLAEQRGDYRSAAAEVRRATETLPRSPDVLVEGARLLERMGRVTDAEVLAERALTIDANDRDALTLLADSAATRALRGEKSDAQSRTLALSRYARLMALGEVDDETLGRVVQLHLDAGDRPAAIAVGRTLVAQKPGDAHAVGLLAQLLLEERESREALEVLLAFLATHPGESPLIRVAQELTRELEAWDLVERAFSAPEGSGLHALDVQRLRGEALLRLDRVEPASKVLADLAERDPEDRAVRYHLARTYRRMGRLGEASDLVRALADAEDKDGRMRLLLAEILDDQGANDAALVEYRTVLQQVSAEAADAAVRDAIRRRISVLELTRGRLDAGQAALDSLEAPGSAESVLAHSRAALARFDWDAAREAARQLRALGDTGTAALVEAEAWLRAGRPARAESKVAEAIQAIGPGARVRLAEMYHELELEDEGAALLRAWTQAEPESAEAHYHLGSYLSRAGDAAGAEAELREAFRLDPAHAGALNFLGYSWAETGAHLEEAIGLVRRALEVDPWNGAYLDSLGWVLYQMGRYAEAKQPIEQAARTFPYDPTVLEHQGDLYERLGDREAAIVVWERALALAPDRALALQEKIRGQMEPSQAAVDTTDDDDDAGAAAAAAPTSGPTPRP
jgi:tetratricopeptide (TPR) repeat protein